MVKKHQGDGLNLTKGAGWPEEGDGPGAWGRAGSGKGETTRAAGAKQAWVERATAERRAGSVSYTHLTLPTILRV